ncbi:peptide deformylase [Buchnera aphidicola (Taiwanaphis decaspermi)]|uniref:peptide deformylase n=1 Tax=Buchnera aphidicola TaxID=9 RepID=UPI0031B89EC8
MTIYKILHYPDKRLRKLSEPVIYINDNIKKITNDMFDTMYKNNGIGLAAPQINIHLQIIVINTKKKMILINPKLISKKGCIEFKEGCLSIPNEIANIKRSKNIIVESMDIDGKLKKIKATGILSVCIQHEIDHLKGKLFIDHLSLMKKERLIKKIKKKIKLKNIKK